MKYLSLILFILVCFTGCSSLDYQTNRELTQLHRRSQNLASLCEDENRQLSKEQKNWCIQGKQLLESESFEELSVFSKRPVTLADITTLVWGQQQGYSFEDIDKFLGLELSEQNPYCESEFFAYEVFQVLEDFVLAEGCVKSVQGSCGSSGRFFVVPQKQGEPYFDGLILQPDKNECSVYAGTYTYKAKNNVEHTVPVLMFIPKMIDKLQINKISEMRERKIK